MSDSGMKEQFIVKKGRLYPLGLHKMQNGLSIVSDIIGRENSGIMIWPEGDRQIRLPFTDQYRIGDLYCLLLQDFPYSSFAYTFYRDDEPVGDPYAKLVDAPRSLDVPLRRNGNCGAYTMRRNMIGKETSLWRFLFMNPSCISCMSEALQSIVLQE